MAVQFSIEQQPDGTLEVTAYTDAPYSPDLADDLGARAVAVWRGAWATVATDLPDAT
jgi:hypothetical protein